MASVVMALPLAVVSPALELLRPAAVVGRIMDEEVRPDRDPPER